MWILNIVSTVILYCCLFMWILNMTVNCYTLLLLFHVNFEYDCQLLYFTVVIPCEFWIWLPTVILYCCHFMWILNMTVNCYTLQLYFIVVIPCEFWIWLPTVILYCCHFMWILNMAVNCYTLLLSFYVNFEYDCQLLYFIVVISCKFWIWLSTVILYCCYSMWLIVLGFNDTPTLVGHFVSSPREREKRDRRDSSGDLREGQWILNMTVNCYTLLLSFYVNFEYDCQLLYFTVVIPCEFWIWLSTVILYCCHFMLILNMTVNCYTLLLLHVNFEYDSTVILYYRSSMKLLIKIIHGFDCIMSLWDFESFWPMIRL